jgi:hypothetical protein
VAAVAKAHHATLHVTPGRAGGLDVEVSFTGAAAALPVARDGAREKTLAAT